MDGNPADIPYIPARDQYGPLQPTMVVIHDEEFPEILTSAEDVAHYFQHPPRTGSAHYTIDVNSIVQCVPDHTVAAHAINVNHCAIGLEHAGYAGQTAAEWKDAYSWAMLQRSAAFLATKCKQYGIPTVLLTAQDLAAGKRAGITTHANVSAGLPQGGSGHSDPGPNFPLAEYIAMVANGAHTVAPPKSLGFKPGDVGRGVHFYAAMLNLEANRRINDLGKAGGRQLDISGDPAKTGYGPKIEAATVEFQRFINTMLHLQGKPPIALTGVADPEVTIPSLAFWVNHDHAKK